MPRIRVWDLPLRIVHWALAFCVIAAYISQSIGGNAMVWHGRFGLAVLGLVTFRLVWGFVGSTNARFHHFVRGPKAIAAYLRGQWSGLGHNPLGALSVLALLGVPLLLTLTGLFANDDIVFEGPLYALVSKDLSDRITKIHHWFEPVILILVG
ncbi:MAG: cytochrome b/b6 domain-containing protein, partial [Rugosibacter sp.]